MINLSVKCKIHGTVVEPANIYTHTCKITGKFTSRCWICLRARKRSAKTVKSWRRPFRCRICQSGEYSIVSTTRAGYIRRCIMCDRRRSAKAFAKIMRTPRERDKRREYENRLRRKVRAEMIAAYGGQCACCGENHPEFMSIDHIGGGGHAHRRTLRNSHNSMARELKRLGFPKDKFRLLCMNCNWAKGMYGYCPHGKS